MVKLRPHQKDAWKSIKSVITKGKGSAIGRVVMPTGAGKTFVEAQVIEHQITKNSVSKIHLVLAPRILLANQLISEYRKFEGTPYRTIAFHSGTHEPDYQKIKWQEIATTRVDSLKDEWAKAKRKKQDLVVFSTYHSCGKLAGINFDTIVADESQYCVAEDFNNAIRTLTGRVRLFFTATERFTASNTGRGLNNESFYGERLYSITPAELIKLGLIVAPRLHIMYGETRDEESSIISEVVELAKEQDNLTRPDLGFSKILFAMAGTDDVKTVLDNISKLRKEMPLHDVFTITSKTGAMINGNRIRREEFITELTKRENCLIFHYDILSEGIDVDGITGVGLMRNMGLAKLLQTIGRAIRIYKPDPSLKTQAWISVPVLNGNEDDKEQVKHYVNAIRNAGFDVSAETVHESGKPRHSPDNTTVDDAYTKYKNNFASLFITEVFHEIEEAEFWNDIKSSESMEEDLDILFT
jgi:superfamily II DNA or RNA helicase